MQSYADLKEFYKQMIDKQLEKVVLWIFCFVWQYVRKFRVRWITETYLLGDIWDHRKQLNIQHGPKKNYQIVIIILHIYN